ncbi:uncharacterized protein LOC112611112 [Theropithecus gelada]|uniref:uncharacterized protein LOC112611112 n=1 Tax=Theropithecus gelada TaxID=9565 RepID=UPI000DC166BB|nr:uncharacterized protein LOC112611112 [Theropithecus gelada]
MPRRDSHSDLNDPGTGITPRQQRSTSPTQGGSSPRSGALSQSPEPRAPPSPARPANWREKAAQSTPDCKGGSQETAAQPYPRPGFREPQRKRGRREEAWARTYLEAAAPHLLQPGLSCYKNRRPLQERRKCRAGPGACAQPRPAPPAQTRRPPQFPLVSASTSHAHGTPLTSPTIETRRGGASTKSLSGSSSAAA